MCNSEIEIIQGDTLVLNINVNEGIELIDKMFFTSKELDVNVEATFYGENVYQVVVPSEKTKGFEIGSATYDITVIKKNEQQHTPIHNGFLIVLGKENDPYAN